MIWAAPWALLGLLALPVVWWLHRRLRKPPLVDLPSLIFLVDEAEARTLPRGSRFDAELLLALTAILCLALAAAGPQFVQRKARRVVSVVVSGGSSAEMRGYTERVTKALDSIRAALASDDRMRVAWVPGPAERARFVPRPPQATLLSAAAAGKASLRVVISDVAAPPETHGVHWVAIGQASLSNQALVSSAARNEAGDTLIFCTVANYGPEAVTLRLRATPLPGGAEVQSTPSFKLRPDGMRSQRFRFEVPTDAIDIEILGADGAAHRDALARDDAVQLRRRRMDLFVDPSLPAPLRTRIDQALEAAVGRAGFQLLPGAQAGAADLAFVRRGSTAVSAKTWTLAFEPLVDGQAGERAPPGADPLGKDPLVRDLSTAGPEWVFASSARVVGQDETVLLRRRAASDWPVVLRRDRRVRLAPDPLRGEPPPVDTPFWPILIDNLLHEARLGGSVGAGYRASGLLDPASSRPGGASVAFAPAALQGLKPSIPAIVRPLRPFLILGALACMLLLWGAPRLRRRLGAVRRPARRTAGAA